MEVYVVMLKALKKGYIIHQPEFDITINADDITAAMNAMRDQIEIKGSLMLRTNQPLPQQSTQLITDVLEGRQTNKNDTIYGIVHTDIEKKFKESASESVRKNISMPAWMDIQLRYYGVDASKMFQDAATVFIEAKKKESLEIPKITTLEQLTKYVDEDLLKEYFNSKIFNN